MHRDTSKEAFNGVDRATMCVRMLGIYRIHGKLTDKEFQKISGWEINQVTARRNDLLNKKDCWGHPIPDVEMKGKKKNSSNRTVLIWGLITEGQREMF